MIKRLVLMASALGLLLVAGLVFHSFWPNDFVGLDAAREQYNGSSQTAAALSTSVSRAFNVKNQPRDVMRGRENGEDRAPSRLDSQSSYQDSGASASRLDAAVPDQDVVEYRKSGPYLDEKLLELQRLDPAGFESAMSLKDPLTSRKERRSLASRPEILGKIGGSFAGRILAVGPNEYLVRLVLDAKRQNGELGGSQAIKVWKDGKLIVNSASSGRLDRHAGYLDGPQPSVLVGGGVVLLQLFVSPDRDDGALEGIAYLQPSSSGDQDEQYKKLGTVVLQRVPE